MTPLATYAERLAALHGQESDVKWQRGDVLLRCEREHGDAWTTLADDPRAPSRQVLTAERRTSEAFPPDRRRNGLSWSHHWRAMRVSVEGEDGKLDADATDRARDELLDEAELYEWSVADLDTEVTARREQEENDAPPADPTELERVPYIVARARELGSRVTDGTVADVLAADHEWRTARERLPFDDVPGDYEHNGTISDVDVALSVLADGEVPF